MTPELRHLDPYSRSMLYRIGESEAEDRRLRVSDFVASGEFGSPPTVYARLKDLEEAGLVMRITDSKDRRSKSLHLTLRAKKL